MDHLRPLDVSFLELEDADPHVSLAIASTAILDGPVPSQAEFAAALRDRLPLMPRYRQRVQYVPLDLAPPFWADDPAFDLDFHLRRSAVAAPGDDAALTRLIARVMSQRLDRDRPLWECWVIEGLPHGRWALLVKIHHCMLDGIAGTELYRLMCAPAPASTAVPAVRPGRPNDQAADLVTDLAGRFVRLPFDQVRMLLAAARRPRVAAGKVSGAARGLAALAAELTPAARTTLSGSLGTARRYAVARVPLGRIAAIADGFGVSVNDVYLAAVAGAFRGLILARGETPDPDAVRTLVPVSVRGHADRAAMDNRFAQVLLLLPVDIDDPAGRLMAVHHRMAVLRSEREAEASAVVQELAEREPFAAVSAATRAALWLSRRAVVTVTTNVPGPREQLRLLGRQIREILPYVPVAEHIRIGVAMLSYHGRAAFGVTTDFAAVPEAPSFAASIVDEIGELHRITPRPAGPATSAQPFPSTLSRSGVAARRRTTRRIGADDRGSGPLREPTM